ncbi:caspase, EACC1-associated type [Scytonema millei]|uniref:SUMF1/EgtB/PvdO family nonheme iron enzyme n=1 Tax=Scytonema millei VB511283 TaxID=1245923 RepID=A0A9X5E6Q1_9CYAN|nr:SUMF1/EgtB/PvdO family nonheme iron enzyme [Scytonema millei]NHC36326.1 SUMF1/EgtB/PvdO family nonheme iron enzyme [Scytonema millei VB511283]
MSKKVALLIGVSEYGEGIPLLKAPPNDVVAIQRVLQNPQMGGFDEVTPLINPEPVAMQQAIQRLFRNANKEDLVLLFFSGHGITDDENNLFLATRITAKDNFEATAVSANFIQKLSKNSYAKRQVIILDCCYSGAFAEGWQAKSVGLDLKRELGAEGRVVLTSATATQTSFEQEGAELSLYTQYLVEGIETGAADKDGDGKIHARELHDYAKTKVQEVKPKMQPGIILDKEGFNILLSLAPVNDPELEFRQLVEQYVYLGEISNYRREFLNLEQEKRGILDEKAEEIINSVLEPFRRRQANLARYEEAFRQEVERQYPLDRGMENDLRDWQQFVLGLEDEYVAEIQQRVISEVEKKQNLTETKLEAASSQATTPSNKSTSQPLHVFEFDVVTVADIQQSGWLGLGGKRAQVKSDRSQAQFFKENFGNGITLAMVAIPGGKFIMGSPTGEGFDKERPQHEVTVQPFFMGKFQVTQVQWKTVANLPRVNRDLKPNPSYFKGNDRPVETVSWYDAVEFCDRLSRHTNKQYRLPSEAEWEYACRAGTTTPFHFGETITTDLVNYDGNYTYGDAPKGEYRQQTTPVGSFSPNAFGLYDMHGNVWEWCADTWHENYSGAPTDGSAWVEKNDNKNKSQVLRGGSWISYPGGCRSAYRGRGRPDVDSNAFGFRVACGAARTQ